MNTNFYFNPETYEIVVSDVPVSHLRKISPITFLLIAPCLGGLFVLFLPVIGFALIVKEIRTRVIEFFRTRYPGRLFKAHW